MPLFMPQDPPDSLGEFKPLGPAKRPPVEETPVVLEKTGTPGIVRNSKTGKLQTDLPEPQQKLIPLEEPEIKPIPWQDKKSDEKAVKDLVAEYQKYCKENIENSLLGYQREYLNETDRRNFFEGTCTSSTPRQEGKSLITEMYKKYAMMDTGPRIVLKGRPDMIVMDDLTEDNRDDWMNWIKGK